MFQPLFQLFSNFCGGLAVGRSGDSKTLPTRQKRSHRNDRADGAHMPDTPQSQPPYPLSRLPMPMKRLLAIALTAAALLMGTSATACEKHLNGHQNGSDTNLEGSKK